MWIRFVTTMSVLSVLAVAGSASADDKDKPGKGKGKGKGRQATPETVFKKMDANGDGKVSLEEFRKFREQFRAKRDKGKSKRGTSAGIFKRIDTNGDSYLSKEELKKRIAQLREQKAKLDRTKIETLKKKQEEKYGK